FLPSTIRSSQPAWAGVVSSFAGSPYCKSCDMDGPAQFANRAAAPRVPATSSTVPAFISARIKGLIMALLEDGRAEPVPDYNPFRLTCKHNRERTFRRVSGMVWV